MRIYLHFSNRKRFLCLHSLTETQEGLGEFKTVMQTRDEVECLHKLSHGCIIASNSPKPPECLYQAMQTQEKRLPLLLQNNFL